jgi:cytochrome c-type biogenesis protein CcmH/NrfF
MPNGAHDLFALWFVIPAGNLLLPCAAAVAIAFLSVVAFLSVTPGGDLRLLFTRKRTNPRPIRLSLMSFLHPKLTKAALLATLLLSVSLLGAADPEVRFNKLGHDMICMCGCNQILVECNHVGCPVSPVMIGELRDQIDKGGPDNLIFNWFAAKYGATAIAAPMRGGFDDVAWITPLAVFFLATVGVAFLVTVWKKRNPPIALAPAGPSIDEATRNRIRRETEY